MADFWMAVVVTCVVFGFAGNFFAKKTGRNPLLWAAMGIGLNLLVLAAMIIAVNRSEKAVQ